MKKCYMKPECAVIAISFTESHMLSDSETARNVDGGPTGEGLPGTVGETDDDTDPYSGHGQGSGGGGNRSKWGNLWNDFEDEEDW